MPKSKQPIRPRGRPPFDDVLTPAEWRVVWAAQHGLKNREIATRLNISLDTVKFHIANAVSKLQQPNKKALLSWLGEPKNSAINSGEIMSQTASIESIGQIARTVSDISVSETWYRDVLGLTHLYTFGKLAFFECGGVRLMLSQGEDGIKDESIIYLKTGDIKVMHAELIERGANFSNAPHMVHKHDNGVEEWMAFMTDPDGRAIGLMAQY